MYKYATLKEGDTLEVKFQSAINEVCQKKGCWMNVALENDNSAFVKFKDYAFFVPMNAENKDVIVEGKAYVSIESIDDLKHYAKDGSTIATYRFYGLFPTELGAIELSWDANDQIEEYTVTFAYDYWNHDGVTS